ncbi:MAG: hypothetical protein HY821_02590 [Acidobacteria bacterium]|nr:hypothetical protein [Acidobacteriota bacterium]
MKWTDDDLDLALRELKDEPLPLGATEAVRARVLAEVEKPRRRWWTWAWAPALAAGLMVWAVIPREQVAVAPPPVLARVPEAAVPKRTLEVVKKPELRPAVRRVERAVKPEKETQFVKLVTDDPDVVILWAMNSEGEDR